MSNHIQTSNGHLANIKAGIDALVSAGTVVTGSVTATLSPEDNAVLDASLVQQMSFNSKLEIIKTLSTDGTHRSKSVIMRQTVNINTNSSGGALSSEIDIDEYSATIDVSDYLNATIMITSSENHNSLRLYGSNTNGSDASFIYISDLYTDGELYNEQLSNIVFKYLKVRGHNSSAISIDSAGIFIHMLSY